MEGVPSGVMYLQYLFPHRGAAKHRCCFLELLTGVLLRMPLPRILVNSPSGYVKQSWSVEVSLCEA
jgi:hypothetical protein